MAKTVSVDQAYARLGKMVAVPVCAKDVMAPQSLVNVQVWTSLNADAPLTAVNAQNVVSIFLGQLVHLSLLHHWLCQANLFSHHCHELTHLGVESHQ